jgi:hypothetical protein
MSKTDDGGTAFPLVVRHERDEYSAGMSLRDYFAAKAMQAMVGNYRVVNHRNPLIEGDTTTTEPHRSMMLDTDQKTGEHHGAVEIAGDAYAVADAMLRQRAKEAK